MSEKDDNKKEAEKKKKEAEKKPEFPPNIEFRDFGLIREKEDKNKK